MHEDVKARSKRLKKQYWDGAKDSPFSRYLRWTIYILVTIALFFFIGYTFMYIYGSVLSSWMGIDLTIQIPVDPGRAPEMNGLVSLAD